MAGGIRQTLRNASLGLYNPLLLCTLNNVEDLSARALDFEPGVWFVPAD